MDIESAIMQLSPEEAEYAFRLDDDLFWSYMAERGYDAHRDAVRS